MLHVYAGNLYGGVETLLATLARHSSEVPELEQRFALCFEGRLSEELRAAGAQPALLGEVRWGRPWTVLRARRRLQALLTEQPVDVVLCHSVWSQSIFASAVRRAQARLAFYAHDTPSGDGWLERLARLTPPDVAIANSRYTEGHLDLLFPGVRSFVVYPAVASPPPVDRGTRRPRLCQELSTPEDAVVVAMASRLERWKGHTLLFRALAQLPRDLHWVCWLAGGAQRRHEREYLTELRALAAELDIAGRIRFLGERRDVPQLYACADIHCQPNLGPEPFGIAFVEALQAGLPVVTTDLGAPPEYIDDSCGRLVPPNDPEALSAALEALIRDGALRQHRGEGLTFAVDRFVLQLLGAIRETSSSATGFAGDALR